MFTALHWDYLHRVGLVAPFPAVLGAVVGGGAGDEQLRSELLSEGIVVERGLELALEESRRPVFEAFTAPSVKLFGTVLLYRDALRRSVSVDEVAPQWRELAEATSVLIPQVKFLVAVTDEVVSAAVQHQGCVSVSGVDCVHADSVVQAARLLWEALAPGQPYSGFQEVSVGFSTATAASRVRVGPGGGDGFDVVSGVLAEAGVGAERRARLLELLRQEPQAAAQVCVSVWSNDRRVESEDAALGLLQFDAGVVLSVPGWRVDGSCDVTYMPATPGRWEKEIAEFVAHYQRLTKIA
ncbi:hypothetical protein KL864_31115 [Mycolicibacterium goodii]|uniref:hypothetical protein n=1 Tax=Mycolicibacterium goodii TaxID=134601 RepID=UPI001BDD12D7|nr:hypothetical protein [Mycolicibacterium goodii]MBU8820333.1 hypothetical protein [Mycolicibacterium goodii]